MTKNLIDGATRKDINMLWKYGVILIVLIVLERLLTVLAGYYRMITTTLLQKHMQSLVTESLLKKEYSYLKGYHSGNLVNRVFSDVSVVKNGVITLFPTLLKTSVSFIGAAAILITWDWRFVPVLIVSGTAGLLITVYFREPMKRRHKRMQEAEAKLHSSTQESLENIRLIKASLSEERAIKKMNVHRTNLADEQLRNGKISIAFNNGMGLAFDVSWLLCYIWGCIKIFHNSFTYGSLAALIQLVGRIQSPIANAVSLVSQTYGVVASAERLQEVIYLPDEEYGDKLYEFDEIQLKNVNFQYEDGVDEVLIDVEATISRGDFVVLTGISGGGKTSLFQLLLGLYKPKTGTVSFKSGNRIYPASRSTRNLFAYVPQGNSLMSGTLIDNLTMFTDDVTEEDLSSAIHAACLDELVNEVGLNVRIGERGIGLSEGQAQRVAVARALLSNAPILLLDEATSALDEKTEAIMLSNIEKMRNKTVIIVTHRRAAISICDYELHIENGRMTLMSLSENNTNEHAI